MLQWCLKIDVRGRISFTIRVYLGPTLKLNLVFCVKLDNYGISSTLERGKCMVTTAGTELDLVTSLSEMETGFM